MRCTWPQRQPSRGSERSFGVEASHARYLWIIQYEGLAGFEGLYEMVPDRVISEDV